MLESLGFTFSFRNGKSDFTGIVIECWGGVRYSPLSAQAPSDVRRAA